MPVRNKQEQEIENYSTNKKTPHVQNKTEIELANLAKKQRELGKTCAVLQLTKADLYFLDEAKRKNKMEVLRYVIDKGLTIEDLEKAQNQKHFDPSDYLKTL